MTTRYGDRPVQVGEYSDGSPKYVTRRHLAKINTAQRRLGYELTIVQGSFRSGQVSASAGTHDGGGVIDLAAYDFENKCRVFREMGDTAWHRLTIPGVWSEHIHTNDLGCQNMSDAAQEQRTQYLDGLDGLADHAADNQWRPDPIPKFRIGIGAYIGTYLPAARRGRVDFHKTRYQATNGGHKKNPGVKLVQIALNRKVGAGLTVDGHFGPRTKRAYASWQKKITGHGGSGIPTLDDLTRLGKRGKAKFTVSQ